VGAIFLGRAATILFVTLVSIFGFKEYARATGLYRDWVMTAVVYLGIVAVGVVSFIHDPLLDSPGWYGLFAILPAYVITAILLVPIVRNRSQGQLQMFGDNYLFPTCCLTRKCYRRRAYGDRGYRHCPAERSGRGRRQWKKRVGYHRRSLAETAIIG